MLALDDSRVARGSVDRATFRAAFVDARILHGDGLAPVQHIRKSPSHSTIPAVMLTGFDDVETMRVALKAGVAFFQHFNATRHPTVSTGLKGSQSHQSEESQKLGASSAGRRQKL